MLIQQEFLWNKALIINFRYILLLFFWVLTVTAGYISLEYVSIDKENSIWFE